VGTYTIKVSGEFQVEELARTRFIWFVIGSHQVLLNHERMTQMADTLHIDQTAVASIQAKDKNGNLIPGPVFETPGPVWASSNPAVATVTGIGGGPLVPPNVGPTATIQPLSLGITNITVSANIGGVNFSASNSITVVSGAVASISIVLTPQPAG
jgi:hypothetical protein